MNDDTLKSLLRTSAPPVALRSADAFWSAVERHAQDPGRAPALPRRLGLTLDLLRRWQAPAWAAAAAALVAAVVRPGAHAPALDQFRIGDELPNNGALVITDSDTDATILWVITEET
jgi:hypothetical protein